MFDRFFSLDAYRIVCSPVNAVVGLYLRIFIFISARMLVLSAGIRRETSLAKRISVVVLSVPNLFMVIFSPSEKKTGM